MQQIQVLDQITIDKIAAGEVIERPASIVKELVENAIDAKASSITVEILDGGVSFIRITDNGIGIPNKEVANAFLRHSTSKIRSVEDLTKITSLGFRGEALSSIAAVSKVELITKTKEEDIGTKYIIEGGVEKSLEAVGGPEGTTFLIRQLFYNVPARRKFLKTFMTEAGHIQDLLMRLALSHPLISFQFISSGQEKLHTSGNGKLRDVIYSLYGREAALELIDIDYEQDGLHITGYLGKPAISRGNRSFENFFVNNRYVKSAMISKAIESAYKDYVMQHKFPFVVLHFYIDGNAIDVNVHPSKTELRFENQQAVYNVIYEGVRRTLLDPELIPVVEAPNSPSIHTTDKVKESIFLLKPTTKETVQLTETVQPAEIAQGETYFLEQMKNRVHSYHNQTVTDEKITPVLERTVKKEGSYLTESVQSNLGIKEENAYEAAMQLDLFDGKLLSRDKKAEYKLIGQVFDTYWLVQFQESLYIIDQHAAHERVLYEKTLQQMRTREHTSQYVSPPIILTLSMQEEVLLKENMQYFERIGFEIEAFGGREYAVRAVPDNLFSIAKKDLLMEMLDSLMDGITTSMPGELIEQKIASMSCKAAVKGNHSLSAMEMDSLIELLLTLDNPYHCPHGRPTIIAMPKKELEKKFKRIV